MTCTNKDCSIVVAFFIVFLTGEQNKLVLIKIIQCQLQVLLFSTKLSKSTQVNKAIQILFQTSLIYSVA